MYVLMYLCMCIAAKKKVIYMHLQGLFFLILSGDGDIKKKPFKELLKLLDQHCIVKVSLCPTA